MKFLNYNIKTKSFINIRQLNILIISPVWSLDNAGFYICLVNSLLRLIDLSQTLLNTYEEVVGK